LEDRRLGTAVRSVIFADVIAGLSFAGHKIAGDGGVDGRTGDLDFADLLVAAIDVEALLGSGQAPGGEFHDHEPEIGIDGGDAAMDARVEARLGNGIGIGGKPGCGWRLGGDGAWNEDAGVIGIRGVGGRGGTTGQEKKRTQETENDAVHPRE
jgi:hypothetical protein